jgi:pyrimidine operon attenuation protein/uracil phosphoribosyltransferase
VNGRELLIDDVYSGRTRRDERLDYGRPASIARCS